MPLCQLVTKSLRSITRLAAHHVAALSFATTTLASRFAASAARTPVLAVT
jgi:hypothetical protein